MIDSKNSNLKKINFPVLNHPFYKKNRYILKLKLYFKIILLLLISLQLLQQNYYPMIPHAQNMKFKEQMT